MKKKVFLLFILILIVLISPKSLDKINEKIIGNTLKLQSEKNIQIDKGSRFIRHRDNIVFYDGKILKSIDSKGNERFKLRLNIKKFNLYSNKYIDILDKDKNIVISINDEGKTVFRKKVANNGIKYESLDNDSYIYAYKDEHKDVVNIYDLEGGIRKSLELNGKLTDIFYTSNGIYICELNTEKDLESIITYYDYNGNFKNKKIINDSIILGSIVNKEIIYLIQKNNVTKLDRDLNIKKEFNINDITFYSNLDKNGFYIIEQGRKIKLINDNVNEVSLSDKIKNIDGIINLNNTFILYKDNKILDKKGKEIKIFDSNVNEVLKINKSAIAVKLDNKIQILTII